MWCMLQVWHAVGRDRQPLRKQYLEAVVPPFIAVLRRWRPLLAGIHELATADGLNPLTVDDRALAADALPLEVTAYIVILISFLYIISACKVSVLFFIVPTIQQCFCVHACMHLCFA